MNNIIEEQNISSNSSNSEKVIRKRNRPDKKTRYAKERNELIEKLNKLIGITETKNSVFLYELEKDANLKSEVEKLVPDIKKYFKYGHWGYFSNEQNRGQYNHIGLMRAVYTDCDYEILSKLKTNTFDDIKKQYTMLMFYKK
jgi:hypothetical protein